MTIQKQNEQMAENPVPESSGLLSCCPHCGGESGYSVSVILWGQQWYKWNGSGENFLDRGSKHTSLFRCLDCNKPIKADIPHLR